jgi:hypothetical protein
MPLLDTQNDDLIPELGEAPKPAQTASASPFWGAKTPAPVTNGDGFFNAYSSVAAVSANGDMESPSKAPLQLSSSESPLDLGEKQEPPPSIAIDKPVLPIRDFRNYSTEESSKNSPFLTFDKDLNKHFYPMFCLTLAEDENWLLQLRLMK